MSAKKLTGVEKAAIVMMTLGEEISGEMLKNMSEVEIRRIAGAIQQMQKVDEETAKVVVEEFNSGLDSKQDTISGGIEFTKKALGHAFGNEGQILAEKLGIEAPPRLQVLEVIDPKTLANFLKEEHPQTVAVIMAHLEPKKCGETLRLLPKENYTDLLTRIAKLDRVDPEVLYEIEEALNKEVEKMGVSRGFTAGGVEKIAEMLNTVDKATEERLLNDLEEKDPDLAEKVRALMFTFDDLLKIDTKGIQELIKVIPTDKWKIALKNASETLTDHIFSNMSDRAAKMLSEDMDAMPKLKLSDVEFVQQEIAQTAQLLESEGKIIINRGEDVYV